MKVAVSCLSLLSGQLAAQSLRLERSVEFSTGNAYGSGGIYRGRDLDGGLRVSAGLRLLRADSMGAFIDVSAEALDMKSTKLSDCPPSPRGGCLRYYPRVVGVGALVGVIRQPWNTLEWRAALGGGAYAADGTLVGAILTQGDIGVFPFPRVGVFAGARGIVIPSYRHDRLWMIPWMIGVRLR